MNWNNWAQKVQEQTEYLTQRKVLKALRNDEGLPSFACLVKNKIITPLNKVLVKRMESDENTKYSEYGSRSCDQTDIHNDSTVAATCRL